MPAFLERGARRASLLAALLLPCLCSCPLTLDESMWCGVRWRAQISGAHAYSGAGESSPIPATSTTHDECLSVVENDSLDLAEPDDPVYVALFAQLESGAVANCEQAGESIWLALLDYTTCSTTGTPPVGTNISHVGACYEKDLSKWETCALLAGCVPKEGGGFICNPSEGGTGETGM